NRSSQHALFGPLELHTEIVAVETGRALWCVPPTHTACVQWCSAEEGFEMAVESETGDRAAQESSVTRVVETPPVADPAGLGLAAFALTTFLLSAVNADWVPDSTAWVGYAFAYGGLVQLLAGMWEFRNRNVFGAVAFSTYGGFWIGLAYDDPFVEAGQIAVHGESQAGTDIGMILLAFAIFNTYMLVGSTQVNKAVFGVFITLEITEILLFLAEFTGNEPLT